MPTPKERVVKQVRHDSTQVQDDYFFLGTPMPQRLQGKIALITGAASGIGEASSRIMAQEGAHVIVTDISSEKGAKIAQSLKGTFFPLDVRKEQEWKNVFLKAEQLFGRVDILVNNAGITGIAKDLPPQDPEHTSLETWRFVQEVNVEGVFLGCKYAIQSMKKTNGGAIVNMASRSALVGLPTLAAYAASKAAIRNHTKTVALYCAEKDYNIRCNAIFPASILTPLWDPMVGTGVKREENLKKMAQGIPLKRMGTPEEVAWAVVYLASNESSFMTGAELVLDGGILAGSPSAPHSD